MELLRLTTEKLVNVFIFPLTQVNKTSRAMVLATGISSMCLVKLQSNCSSVPLGRQEKILFEIFYRSLRLFRLVSLPNCDKQIICHIKCQKLFVQSNRKRFLIIMETSNMNNRAFFSQSNEIITIFTTECKIQDVVQNSL